MKLKLYLRGLGIGLLIGALALLIFGGVNVGSGTDSTSDSSTVGLVTPVENPNENEEIEGTLYATAYPLETSSSEEKSGEVSEEGKEASKTIDEELTSTSDTVPEETDETQEAISQALAKSSDAQENAKTDDASTKDATTKIEVEDGEAFAVTDESDTKKDESGTDAAKSTDTTASETDTAADTTGTESLTSSAEDTTGDTATEVVTGQSVVVQIPGGSDSASVCRVLQNAGAIDDASAFDAYLVSRGLDRYIRSGTYYITAGSSYEDIAKLITGR